MISSTKDASKWVFPKGGWELDETLEEAAERETLEVVAARMSCRDLLQSHALHGDCLDARF